MTKKLITRKMKTHVYTKPCTKKSIAALSISGPNYSNVLEPVNE